MTAQCCPIVELRHYTLRPGKRETLIELFDREFIETQEEAGMRGKGIEADIGAGGPTVRVTTVNGPADIR